MNKEEILTKLSNISAYITLPSEVDTVTIHNELIEVMEYINVNEDKKWIEKGKFYHNCKFDNEEIRDMMDLLEGSYYYNDENVELKDDGSWYDLKIAIHKLITQPKLEMANPLDFFYNVSRGQLFEFNGISIFYNNEYETYSLNDERIIISPETVVKIIKSCMKVGDSNG